MNVTTFYTAKPGQGCTAIAAAAAIAASANGPTVLVSPGPDGAAVLGIAAPEEYPVAVHRPNLTLHQEMPADLDPEAVYVIDAGTNPEEVHGVAYLVTRACYLALRRFTLDNVTLPDGVVLITEPGRALDPSDVAAVIGAPIRAEVGQDHAVARAIDAGLLATRLPRTLARTVGRLVVPEEVTAGR